MTLVILHVPGCPGAAVLHRRLRALGADVTRRVIRTPEEAREQGMSGSPTLLVDGTDPFPAGEPGLACRLYPDEAGRLANAPSPAALRTALGS